MLESNKKILTAAVVAASALMGLAAQSHAAIVINEVYGGGGGTTATNTYAYSQDFIELYNNSPTASVDMTGMKLEYGSATGAIGSNTFSIATLNSLTLAPLSYYLVAGSLATNAVGPTLTGADQTTVLSLAATAGKIELLAADGTTVLDLVGYGSTTTGYAGTGPALGAGNTASISRTITGVDTGNNAADFTAGTPSPTGGGASAVPEPATIGIAALGSAMLLTRRRR